MYGWAARAYRRRIVNVNVNILLANALAVGLTNAVVYFLQDIGIASHWLKIVFTMGIDMFFDVALYYALHWMANHWPSRLPERGLRDVLEESPKPSFFRDATTVQAQRLCLSPLFYAITVIGMKWALLSGWNWVFASAAAFGTAIVTTRVLHTLWMLRSDRLAREGIRPAPLVPFPTNPPAQSLRENGVKSVPVSK